MTAFNLEVQVVLNTTSLTANTENPEKSNLSANFNLVTSKNIVIGSIHRNWQIDSTEHPFTAAERLIKEELLK